MYVALATVAVYVLPLLATIGFVAFCVGVFKDVDVDHRQHTIRGLSPVLIRRGGWLFAFSLLSIALMFTITGIQALLYLTAFTAIPALGMLLVTRYRKKGFQLITHKKDLDRRGGHIAGWSHLMTTTWVLLLVCTLFAIAAATRVW